MSPRLVEVLIAAAVVVVGGYLVIDLLWIIDGLMHSKKPPLMLFTLAGGAVPVRDWVPWGALLWPIPMFVVHVRLTTMTSGRWFGTVMQASWALIPLIGALYDLKLLTA